MATTGVPRRPLQERFWPKVDKAGECWIWTGATVRGYGVINEGGKHGRSLYAHRVSWELTTGPIPEGGLVLHTCDNPPCVRPDHLSIGAQSDNMSDAASRHRTSHGEQRANHKLTEHDVTRMRELHAAGMNARQMAGQYPVTERTIRKILAGRNWRHI